MSDYIRENTLTLKLKHLKKVINHGGISFLILEINDLIYLLDGKDIISFTQNSNRKSIPYDYIKKKGFLIELKYNPYLDYIKIIDKHLIGGKNEKEN